VTVPASITARKASHWRKFIGPIHNQME